MFPNEYKTLCQQLIDSESLHIVFQPIYDVSANEPMGYEALTRGPSGHPLEFPNQLFEVAHTFGLLSKLELLCRKLAFQRFSELALDGKLFINVSPHTIEQKCHPHGETLKLLEQFNLKPEQLVIEVTERFEATDPSLLKDSLQHYRDLGLRIAIDDLGTGHSGLKQWAELRPDIVKIDRYFISDCHNNIVKRELLRTIFEMGKATGVAIIAEGIEQHDEYILLKNLGMQYAQGYLLAKPAVQPSRRFPEQLLQSVLGKSNLRAIDTEQFEIGKLVKTVTPVDASAKCIDVYRMFKLDDNQLCVAVVDRNNRPIGLVYRDQLAELFSSDYGRALYSKKDIDMVMNHVMLAVEIGSPIDEISKYITDNDEFDKRPEFIVTNKGQYVGLANVRSLLKKMTEEKIKHAQHANPLTMLPGNVVIQQRIDHLLGYNIPFSMAYFDLDHFKPFNDIYGYAAGDNVIKLVADILSEVCHEHFVGHVGGDDFVVIFQTGQCEALCLQVLEEFAKRIQIYFQPEHLKQRGYCAKDRDGKKKHFPLLDISCGVIHPDVDILDSHHDVSILASEAKKQAKRASSGVVYVQCPEKLQA